MWLTHWGQVTHLCVSKLTSIASDNGLPPGRRQAIIWNNAGILLIGPLGTNFSEICIEIQTFSLRKIRLKMSSAKCRPFCLGLNVLREDYLKPFSDVMVIPILVRWRLYYWIEPSSVYLSEHSLDSLHDHQSSPHHRGVFRHQETHRHAANI